MFISHESGHCQKEKLVVSPAVNRVVQSLFDRLLRLSHAAKDRRANKIIEEKGLSIGFKAITFGTYGAFGKATHKLIASATANTPRPVFSPWVRPSPKQHAYLLFGFCLARANARMLINAASKRSSAKNAVRASRPRSTSPVAVNG